MTTKRWRFLMVLKEMKINNLMKTAISLRVNMMMKIKTKKTMKRACLKSMKINFMP
jgi:hypothetical protein